MKTPNRDLLVLVKDESFDKKFMENELEQLNMLLIRFETIENICTAHEVFDLNRYRIILQPRQVEKHVHQKDIKPFVFICNKN
jgi:hypothetical protein